MIVILVWFYQVAIVRTCWVVTCYLWRLPCLWWKLNNWSILDKSSNGESGQKFSRKCSHCCCHPAHGDLWDLGIAFVYKRTWRRLLDVERLTSILTLQAPNWCNGLSCAMCKFKIGEFGKLYVTHLWMRCLDMRSGNFRGHWSFFCASDLYNSK